MSRSKWKAPAAQMITSKSRVILPSDVASSISVSTGKTQLTFKFVQPMVGHRVGEFYLVHKFAVSKKKTNVRGKR
jgi:ribosomal protein S19